MTTLILSSVGGMLGGSLGAIAGSYLGSYIDNKIFGSHNIKHLSSYRLDDLSVQTSTFGKTIPIVYGSVRISGNIIWSMPIKEVVSTNSTTQNYGKGFLSRSATIEKTTYNYFANIAIGICEGEIDSVERIWADTILLDKSRLNFRLYKGSEDQNPDPFIQAVEGIENTPAYRGLAYIVIEDFQINEFGNRIPNFTFEVKRNLINEHSVENKISAINMIPGSGEFVYDSQIQYKIPIQTFGESTYQTSTKIRINNNTENSNQSDAIIGLDQLRKTLPALKTVSVIVCWFADNLEAEKCKIYPAVEGHNYTTSPDEWRVADLARWDAKIITKDKDNKPIYGGTPSDKSLISYLKELKARNYEVILYPMIFMDILDKPWRGRISAKKTKDIEQFFGSDSSKNSTNTFTYFEFIKHYANLTKDFIDSFIVGSELKGLTSFLDEENYPAVDKLVELAEIIKKILPNKIITYAADWSEYHSSNGKFHMDKLWSSPNIDVVGIDGYFPLTDIKSYSYQPSLEEIINGWMSGEGYSYYYNSSREKIPYDTSLYAWKNIQYWWENFHPKDDGSNTDWKPKMKKIWFTEYGFPSIHANTNMPNIFYNPESSEGGLPVYSNGGINFDLQRLAIEATLKKWQDSAMIEKMILWCYDARPYPQFPISQNTWADGNLWIYGHWVNGKLNRCLLSRIIEDLITRVLSEDIKINTEQLSQSVEGFVITHDISVLNILRSLSQIYFFDAIEDQDQIRFIPRAKQKVIEISEGNLILEKGIKQLFITRADIKDIPKSISLSFISSLDNYEIRTVKVTADNLKDSDSTINIDLPIVMTSDYATCVAQVILYSNQYQRELYELSLPINFSYLEAGDLIRRSVFIDSLNESRTDRTQEAMLREDANIFYFNKTLRIIKINRSTILKIEAIPDDESLYYFRQGASLLGYSDLSRNNKIARTQIVHAILPPFGNETRYSIVFACAGEEDYWNGCVIFDNNEERPKKLLTINQKAIFGKLLNTDTKNKLYIHLTNGELESIKDPDEDENLVWLNDEILQFQNAELIDNMTYKLTNLKRGLYGTESFIDKHKLYDNFILLDESVGQLFLKDKDFGTMKNFRIVSLGDSFDNSVNLGVKIEK